MIIIDVVQGSEAWLLARCGKATASRIADVTAKGKSGPSVMRATYKAELVIERFTGRPTEKFVTGPMQWGSDHEAEARELYECRYGRDVRTIGLVAHPSIANSLASPDGLVEHDGLIETKCPNSAQHLDTLEGKSIDGRYIKQMQWQMACTGRKWCDFVSFDPRWPPKLKIHRTRVNRDDKMIAELEREVAVFLDEVAATVDALKTKYALRDQLTASLAEAAA